MQPRYIFVFKSSYDHADILIHKTQIRTSNNPHISSSVHKATLIPSTSHVRLLLDLLIPALLLHILQFSSLHYYGSSDGLLKMTNTQTYTHLGRICLLATNTASALHVMDFYGFTTLKINNRQPFKLHSQDIALQRLLNLIIAANLILQQLNNLVYYSHDEK